MTEDSSARPDHLAQDRREDGGDDLSAQTPRPGRKWADVWHSLLRLGLGETALRIGTGLVSIVLILVAAWVMSSFYLKGRGEAPREQAALAAALPTVTPTVAQPVYSPQDMTLFNAGIPRLAQIRTNRPSRSRLEITQYEIQKGDSVFGIAEKFGLTPSSILYGNFDILADDPHRIYPGQKINILPIDGVLYRWHTGDGLNGVAKFFGVTPEDILNWPGNLLNPATIGDLSNPNIAADTQLFIPGGKRAFISWSAPLISRKDPAKAKIFGPGFCGEQIEGAIGRGAFVYPTPLHWLSGFDYTPDTNHWGIDLAGQMGSPIYASDSGVIVYAGWNDWGYGNVLVIDHGNGWQTLYAHLSALNVGCGASVAQAQTIGAMGSTGRSTGPHLHFEIMNAGGVRVDPHSFLPAP